MIIDMNNSDIEIQQNDEKGIVKIGDIEIDGFVMDERCSDCGNKKIYYEKYDAKFCSKENKWLEGACHDLNCEYCKDRPKRPL